MIKNLLKGKRLATIISTLFHPAFVPIIGFFLLHMVGESILYLPSSIFIFTIIIICLFTILIPISSVAFLKWTGKIISIEMEDRKERPFPLLIALISVIMLLVIEKKMHYPSIYDAYFMAITVCYVFSFLLSLSYKISLHSIAWGTLIGFFIGLSIKLGIGLHLLVSALIMFSSIILSARLYLKAHTLTEVLLGWIVSICLAFMTLAMVLL